MLRIASANVNGIRAATRRGLPDWIEARTPDVVALQEMRCAPDQVPTEAVGDYHLTYHAGDRAGRNGVALLTRVAPTAVREGFGHESDPQGRYLEADLDLPGLRLRVGSVYVPKGAPATGRNADPEHYRRKMRFLASFRRHLDRTRKEAAAAGREFLVLGDFNIAHERADVKTWKNQRNAPGFLPEEREWFGSVLGPRRLHDVVRDLHPHGPGPYSWWSWRGQAWANDAGWRIDYHLASPGLAARAVTGGTDREDSYEGRMSDHSPVVVDYRPDPVSRH
ncbi:MAG: exodeoxyribonuclease III [Propioniciclava sp.]